MNELENQKRGLRELVINTCREYNSLVMSVKKDTEHTIILCLNSAQKIIEKINY